MKRLFSYLLACIVAALTFAMVSCADHVTEQGLEQLQKQLDALCEKRSNLETDAGALERLIEAVQHQDELVEFSPMVEGGSIIGFKVIFKDAGEVIVYNRESNLGVFQENGKYYWVADGQPLLDGTGNMVEIAPETPLPQFRTDGGILSVSVDGGKNFTQVGSVDKCLINSVEEDATKVIFTISGGALIVIPKYQALILTLNGDHTTIGAGEKVSVTYEVEGVENADLTVLCGTGWSADITAITTTYGTIEITAPSPISQDKVIVFASDGKGRMVAVEMRLSIDTSGNPDPPDPPEPEVILKPVPAAFEVPLSGGEVRVALITNVDYTVTTDSDWLHYSGTKAVRTDNLSFYAEPNDDVARVATATITSGIYSAIVVFRQVGMVRTIELSEHSFGYGSEGGNKLLTVKSNIPYNFEVSQSWISIVRADVSAGSSDVYIVTTAPNPGCDIRTASIVFAGERVEPQVLEITQAGQTPYMNVSGGPFDFGCTGGIGTIVVSANVEYICELSEGAQGWITLSKEEVDGEDRFSLLAAANESFEPRTAAITFSGEGVDQQTIAIAQEAMVPYLTISQNEFNFGSDGGTGTLTVSSNVEFTYEIAGDWITLSEEVVPGLVQYTITAPANAVTRPRTATVTFTGERVGPQTVTITQQALVPYLTVSPTSFSFGSRGGSGTITVNSNVDYSYDVSGADWITVAPDGSTGQKYSVTAAVNNAFVSRTATIVFSGDLVESATVTVTQSGQTPSLSVSPTILNFGTGGESRIITVSSNVAYTVSSGGSDWLSVSGSPSVGVSYFTATVAANASYDSRSASIVFSGEGVGNRTVMVTQAGMVIPVPYAGTGNRFYESTGKNKYRYGPTIIRNADGSLDMWTSKEGSNYLDYGEYAYQETGTRSQKTANGHTLAQYFNIQHKFAAIQLRLYGTGTTSDAITIKLYRWAGSYNATLATSPIATRSFTNISTGGNRYRVYQSDQSMMSAGEYLWTATGATAGVGIYAYSGSGTISITDAVSYLDGNATDAYNYEMRPRGRATTNYYFADRFAYFHSTDGGVTWTKERDVLFGTEGFEDQWSVCDPGAACFGGWYYLAYTSAKGEPGIYNHCYVARSRTPVGPWYKWNGNGWGGEPAKVITFTGSTSSWGAGEPCIVVKDNIIYFYYTWTEGAGAESGPTTHLATAPVSDDWPAHLSIYGEVIDKAQFENADSCDIKYVEDYGLFYAFHSRTRYRPTSKIAVWTSPDGKNFTYRGDMTGSFQPALGNMGVSGDGMGHIRIGEPQYVGYSYGHNSNANWSSWFSPMYFE